MPDQTVAASVARALLEFAVSRGSARHALVQRSGIDPAKLSTPDERVPFAKYVALMRAGQELCSDPALSLHFGESVHLSELSFASMIEPDSRTMTDMIAMVNRYASLTVDLECEGNGDRFRVEARDGRLLFVDARKSPNEFPELTESTFARAVCSSRPAYGRFLKAVQVTHAAPPYCAEYDRIFQVPVTFGSDRNALVADRSLLEEVVTIPAALSRPITEVLKARAEEMLRRLDAAKSVRGRVEAVLIGRLPTRDVGIESVSRELGLSRQTLFRRLKAERVTFEQVLDELRRKLALELLDGKRASVNETAYQVGFSDPAAFSRAFKRWTGGSPRSHIRGT